MGDRQLKQNDFFICCPMKMKGKKKKKVIAIIYNQICIHKTAFNILVCIYSIDLTKRLKLNVYIKKVNYTECLNDFFILVALYLKNNNKNYEF